jgi:hypothetical protein
VTGKVVASSPRAAPAAPRRAAPPAILAARGAKDAGGGARSSMRLPMNRVMLYSVLLVVGGVLVYVLGANASASTALKKETVFTAGDVLAAANGYTILAATFRGSDADYAAAWAARTELEKRGYQAQVLGYRGSEGYERYELLVGHAAAGQELETALAALRSVRKWPGIEGPPFVAARIVPAPRTAP